MKNFIFFLLISMTPLPCVSSIRHAQGQTKTKALSQPAVSVTLDRFEAAIADPFNLTVTVVAPAGSDVVFTMQDPSFVPFELVGTQDQLDVPVANDLDWRSWTRTYQLECYESGVFTIPPVEVQVNQERLAGKSPQVTISSELPEQADPHSFRDIKDAVEIPLIDSKSSSAWLIWLTIGSVSVAAVLFLLFWLKRRSTSESPQQWALQSLRQLKQEYQTAPTSLQLLPSISDILRKYIQRQFNIAAMQLTTEEFFRKVQNESWLPEASRASLRQVILSADQIKFANFPPTEQQVEHAFESAQSLVHQTTPAKDQPAIPPAEGAA